MPTYEYKCANCGVFEEFHSMTTTLEKCPRCSGEVQRLISQNSNIIFKGSGFHTTDYRSGDYSKKASSDSASASNNPSAQSDNKAS